jgi:protein tyrosine phosphatase
MFTCPPFSPVDMSHMNHITTQGDIDRDTIDQWWKIILGSAVEDTIGAIMAMHLFSNHTKEGAPLSDYWYVY